MGWALSRVFTGMAECIHTNAWQQHREIFIHTHRGITDWMSCRMILPQEIEPPTLTAERTLGDLTCLCLQCIHSHIKKQIFIQSYINFSTEIHFPVLRFTFTLLLQRIKLIIIEEFDPTFKMPSVCAHPTLLILETQHWSSSHIHSKSLQPWI